MTTTRKSATAAEALSEKIPFDYQGVEYEIDPTPEWDYEAFEALSDGLVPIFLRSVLGAEQHARFKATKPKVKDLQGFVEAIKSAAGVSGN
jgi:hypothetical protein